METKNKNCYFFGTFNPIHKGHIEIARQVRERLGFEKVIFVPSYMPPHKVDDLASYADRLTMAELALGKDLVSDIESRLKVPSYTYRTIEHLKQENNVDRINFIIGYDQFFKLESWKEPESLKKNINFIVIPRRFKNGQVIGEQVFTYFKNKGYYFQVLDINFLDVSSSLIRLTREKGEDITGLTTREVKNYIENNRLYSKLAGKKPIR